MEIWEDRLINGVLKTGLISDPREAARLLASDIEIVADPIRASADLWPCVWATAAILGRQFRGRVFVRCGLTQPLPAPAALPARCEFVTVPRGAALSVGIGVRSFDRHEIWGDSGGNLVSFRKTVPSREPANPISAFALAGYLGYAALASIVGVPAFREEFALSALSLPIPAVPSGFVSEGLTFIGSGQLGQAYLALLFFLGAQIRPSTIVLVDKESFDTPNRSTQILLGPGRRWVGRGKAAFLAKHFKTLGWNITGEKTGLTWQWKKPAHHPMIAVLGLDGLEVRRMAISAGYDWFIDAGVGTSLLQPRISWHSLPPDRRLAEALFPPETVQGGQETFNENSKLAQSLKNTPGECGWVTFKGIRATAPSMGIVAAAYAWCLILEVLSGQRSKRQGRACLWSPLLPYMLEPIS